MKWIVILILLFLPVSAIAEIHGFFEIEKAIQDRYANIEVEFQWWIGQGKWKNELYGGWMTQFYVINLRGYPFANKYTIGNRLHYGQIYIGIEHFCDHQITNPYTKYNQNEMTSIYFGVEW